MENCEIGFINQRIVNQNHSLEIFGMTTNTSEPIEEIVKKELLIFRKFQMDVKKIKYPLQWWQKHESIFPTFGFLA
jgi:hypothetical protein